MLGAVTLDPYSDPTPRNRTTGTRPSAVSTTAVEDAWASALLPVLQGAGGAPPEADLVVVRAERGVEHGRRTLGPRAACALAALGRPTAVVPDATIPVRRVGVALRPDGADDALVEPAARLAHAHGAELTILSVVDDPTATGPAMSRAPSSLEVARGCLARAAGTVAASGPVRVLRQLRAGDPVHQVLGFGEQVDVLVLGAGARSATPSGVTEAVCRRTPGAVLVLPRDRGGSGAAGPPRGPRRHGVLRASLRYPTDAGHGRN